MNRFWKWFVVIAVFLIVASIIASMIWPVFMHFSRLPRYKFDIAKTFARPARDKKVLAMKSATQQSVVVEGPCNGGCYGGVLSRQLPIDAKIVISNLQDYDGKTTSMIWLYQVKPISIERRNDIWGDDELTIRGTQMRDENVYMAVVPTYLAAPRLQWIFVETK